MPSFSIMASTTPRSPVLPSLLPGASVGAALIPHPHPGARSGAALINEDPAHGIRTELSRPSSRQSPPTTVNLSVHPTGPSGSFGRSGTTSSLQPARFFLHYVEVTHVQYPVPQKTGPRSACAAGASSASSRSSLDGLRCYSRIGHVLKPGCYCMVEGDIFS